MTMIGCGGITEDEFVIVNYLPKKFAMNGVNQFRLQVVKASGTA